MSSNLAFAATCQRCGTEFTGKRRDAKYCSAACRQAAYAGRPAPDPNRICVWCKQPFYTRRRADARFCSSFCRQDAYNGVAAAARERFDPAVIDQLARALDVSPTNMFMAEYIRQADQELADQVFAGKADMRDVFWSLVATEPITDA